MRSTAGPALIGYAHLGKAKALQRLGQIKPAKEELAESLRILKEGVGDSDSFTMGEALVEAGSFHVDLEEFDVASEYLQRGRKLLLEVGDQQEKALNALHLLGRIDYARGNTQEALDKLSAKASLTSSGNRARTYRAPRACFRIRGHRSLRRRGETGGVAAAAGAASLAGERRLGYTPRCVAEANRTTTEPITLGTLRNQPWPCADQTDDQLTDKIGLVKAASEPTLFL